MLKNMSDMLVSGDAFIVEHYTTRISRDDMVVPL
jgi:hypothetical protein